MTTTLAAERDTGAGDGTRPDPFAEIRMIALSATRGANYWSKRPVTRIDLAPGVYDEISSAEIPEFTERLVAALPGLEEHRCSIGERGGFVTRLNRGTYAPHILEHVALELQNMIGHRVGYGRSRGGDVDGQYTVVFEHVHEATGMRAAALALGIVQQAFAGSLTGSVEHALAELRAIADTPDVPPVTPRVICGVTGGSARAELRNEIAALYEEGALVVDVSPGYILQAGLPYAESEIAVVLDTELRDVPERYQDPERAERVVSVMVDALPRGGMLVAPAKCWRVQDAAREAGAGVAVFSGGDDMTAQDRKVARSAAWVANGEIVIEHRGRVAERVPVREPLSPAVQAAAALVRFARARR